MIDAKLQKQLRDAAFTIDLSDRVLLSYVDDGRPHILATWRSLRVTRLVTTDTPIEQAEADAIEVMNNIAASIFLDLLELAMKGEGDDSA